MKKIILSVLLLASTSCFADEIYYVTIMKIKSNEWFSRFSQDKVKIIEIKNLDQDVNGNLLISYEFN